MGCCLSAPEHISPRHPAEDTKKPKYKRAVWNANGMTREELDVRDPTLEILVDAACGGRVYSNACVAVVVF